MSHGFSQVSCGAGDKATETAPWLKPDLSLWQPQSHNIRHSFAVASPRVSVLPKVAVSISFDLSSARAVQSDQR